MDAVHVFAGLVVSDIDAAKAWYAALIGRDADILPNDSEAMWQLTPTANLYLLADEDRAGGGVAAIAVSDLAAEQVEIASRKLDPGPIHDVGEGGRKSIITDPDGNEVHLLELPSP